MKCICGQRMTRTTKNYHPAYKCSCGKIEVNNQITYITEHAKVKISNLKNMQRQSIIVLLNYTEEPITRGNLKKLCEEFNFPYYTLCRLKFPILYKDFIIHKVEFK